MKFQRQTYRSILGACFIALGALCPQDAAAQLPFYTDAAWFKTLDLDSLCALEEKNLYCVEMDAATAVDPGNPDLIFEWEFASGAIKKGIKADHCYEKPGYKYIWLNVIDPRTNSRQDHDTMITVYCPPQIIPFEMRGAGVIKSFLRFSIPEELQETTTSTFVWQFGKDGPIKRGPEVSQPFSRQGVYRVVLLELIESGTAPPQILSAYCKEVVVRGAGDARDRDTKTIIPKE